MDKNYGVCYICYKSKEGCKSALRETLHGEPKGQKTGHGAPVLKLSGKRISVNLTSGETHIIGSPKG